MEQTKGYVGPEYLQGMAHLLAQLKQHTYELMHIEQGHSVLDVGCGPATDTLALAGLVGESGRVTGIDYDPEMVAAANRRVAEAALTGRVIHRHGDATSLPFEDNTFNSCRSERLFQHLKESPRALAEMVRVTAPSGWIVVLDTDWGTLSIDSTETDIERRLARCCAEYVQNNGYSGRRLYRLFREHKLLDISIEVSAVFLTDYSIARTLLRLDQLAQEALRSAMITEEELELWHTDLDRAARDGTYFSSVSLMAVAGRKPEITRHLTPDIVPPGN